MKWAIPDKSRKREFNFFRFWRSSRHQWRHWNPSHGSRHLQNIFPGKSWNYKLVYFEIKQNRSFRAKSYFLNISKYIRSNIFFSCEATVTKYDNTKCIEKYKMLFLNFHLSFLNYNLDCSQINDFKLLRLNCTNLLRRMEKEKKHFLSLILKKKNSAVFCWLTISKPN